MPRKLQPDGICHCCGKVGPTWYDPDAPPEESLCDRCEYAQRRWDEWHYSLTHPGAGYPYTEGPPRTPPIRRDSDS